MLTRSHHAHTLACRLITPSPARSFSDRYTSVRARTHSQRLNVRYAFTRIILSRARSSRASASRTTYRVCAPTLARPIHAPRPISPPRERTPHLARGLDGHHEPHPLPLDSSVLSRSHHHQRGAHIRYSSLPTLGDDAPSLSPLSFPCPCLVPSVAGFTRTPTQRSPLTHAASPLHSQSPQSTAHASPSKRALGATFVLAIIADADAFAAAIYM